MKYKGYLGVVELDEDSGILFGEVTGLRDVITFQGETVAETIQAFHDSVDDYLEFCKAQRKTRRSPIPVSLSCEWIRPSIENWPTRRRSR